MLFEHRDGATMIRWHEIADELLEPFLEGRAYRRIAARFLGFGSHGMSSNSIRFDWLTSLTQMSTLLWMLGRCYFYLIFAYREISDGITRPLGTETMAVYLEPQEALTKEPPTQFDPAKMLGHARTPTMAVKVPEIALRNHEIHHKSLESFEKDGNYGHFLELHVLTVAYLFSFPSYIHALAPGASASALNTTYSPFTLNGTPNVLLKIVKRGEDDSFKPGGRTTFVLRLYEAFGGQCRAQWRIAMGSQWKLCTKPTY
ncbi:hypothetical protein C8J57DRAFT_1520968 [Mycena rebaudengoi]|nr:hypothetical protein C8J57DRAFT_1520968 [Mycena rebaudengoi]